MLEFQRFLESKSQLYTGIDRFRAFSLFEKYKQDLDFKQSQIVFHIVGTNGKGSTGRFITQLIRNLKHTVAHFTSPHILSFNERFFLNDELASDDELEQAHQKLKNIFKEDLQKLSYFEYCTFLAAVLFKDYEYIVFEAGLGGEYDSTSLFKRDISVFTSISYDHIEILGDSLSDIARTKLKIMSKKAAIARQEPEISNLAKKISYLKDSKLISCENLDLELKYELSKYIQKYKMPKFLEENLALALSALSFIFSKEELFKSLSSLQGLNLRARCERIAKNVYIDVGHNELAARAVADFFKDKSLNLVYNSFLDKDIYSILRILKPISAKIMVYEYESQRALATKQIYSLAKELDIECESFEGIDEDKEYLVFGSFVLVENFLKGFDWQNIKEA